MNNINETAVNGWRRRSPQPVLSKVRRGLKLRCFVLGCFVLFCLVGIFAPIRFSPALSSPRLLFQSDGEKLTAFHP